MHLYKVSTLTKADDFLEGYDPDALLESMNQDPEHRY
jgi:hypothetical protein